VHSFFQIFSFFAGTFSTGVVGLRLVPPELWRALANPLGQASCLFPAVNREERFVQVALKLSRVIPAFVDEFGHTAVLAQLCRAHARLALQPIIATKRKKRKKVENKERLTSTWPLSFSIASGAGSFLLTLNS